MRMMMDGWMSEHNMLFATADMRVFAICKSFKNLHSTANPTLTELRDNFFVQINNKSMYVLLQV